MGGEVQHAHCIWRVSTGRSGHEPGGQITCWGELSILLWELILSNRAVRFVSIGISPTVNQ